MPENTVAAPSRGAAPRLLPPEVADLVGSLGPLDNFHVMTAGRAYRSATLAPGTLRRVLQRCGIRAVINLRGENRGADWYDAERAVCEELGVRLIDVRMSAKELPSCETLLALYDALLATRDQPVLLHCKSGADRTGAAAALWRITVEGWSHGEAAHELSPFYGHFRFYHPLMDRLAGMFVPERRWIEHEYPVP